MATCSITDLFRVDADVFEKAFNEAYEKAVPRTKEQEAKDRQIAFDAMTPTVFDLEKGTSVKIRDGSY